MKHLRWALISSLLVYALGCMPLPGPPKPKQIVRANGQVFYVVQCYQKSDCTRLAEKLCPGGYSVLDEQTEMVTLDVDGSARTLPKDSLEIRCQ